MGFLLSAAVFIAGLVISSVIVHAVDAPRFLGLTTLAGAVIILAVVRTYIWPRWVNRPKP